MCRQRRGARRASSPTRRSPCPSRTGLSDTHRPPVCVSLPRPCACSGPDVRFVAGTTAAGVAIALLFQSPAVLAQAADTLEEFAKHFVIGGFAAAVGYGSPHALCRAQGGAGAGCSPLWCPVQRSGQKRAPSSDTAAVHSCRACTDARVCVSYVYCHLQDRGSVSPRRAQDAHASAANPVDERAELRTRGDGTGWHTCPVRGLRRPTRGRGAREVCEGVLPVLS